jgi:hypothetical protein
VALPTISKSSSDLIQADKLDRSRNNHLSSAGCPNERLKSLAGDTGRAWVRDLRFRDCNHADPLEARLTDCLDPSDKLSNRVV